MRSLDLGTIGHRIAYADTEGNKLIAIHVQQLLLKTSSRTKIQVFYELFDLINNMTY